MTGNQSHDLTDVTPHITCYVTAKTYIYIYLVKKHSELTSQLPGQTGGIRVNIEAAMQPLQWCALLHAGH